MSTAPAPSHQHARPTVRSTRAWAAQSATSPLAPFSIDRRDPLPDDVVIDILYCGVCHSDLHQVRNEWQIVDVYPFVPGHEIVGRVTKRWQRRHEVPRGRPRRGRLHGGLVPHCAPCAARPRAVLRRTAARSPTTGRTGSSGGVTYGGYSESIVVDEAFTLKVSDELDLAATAPLLCAGITTYSPLRHWKVGPGQKVGIVGLGGLGHMGVKFARAFGAHVVLFTTSPSKVDDGMRLGAHEVVVSKNADEMSKHASAFDFILDAVSAEHDINAYLQLLKLDGTLTLVGAPEQPLPVAAFNLLMRAPQLRRIGHRRHQGNAGDARLLRRARHRQRHRDDPDRADQRRLRTDAAKAT